MNDLQIYRGDDKTWEVTFKDGDGVAINITGWTVYFTVKEKDSDTDANAKISKTITSHVNPTGGITDIILVPTDTSSLKGNYYYDIRIKKGSGEKITVLVGTLEVLKNVKTTIP